ncbi:hypothetical protein D4764_09G0002510 [Takifugu flavidus]|uniref:Uncharacterized protein n=1 Tax=Takifugu flavidus TaxID=433684 RepID=A0A5C6MJB5_9TELE|nr:hypothetical protein D4764_09G0002510 [Takifugu flavidus]
MDRFVVEGHALNGAFYEEMEQHHAEAKESNQDGVGDTGTQPSGCAEKERINVTENSSHSLRNCQSNKGYHSRPSDSGENE